MQKILCHSTPHHKTTNDNSPQITPRLSKSRSVEDIHCMSAVQSRGNCDFFKTPKTQMTPKQRVLQHSRSMDTKLTEIHTIITTMDNNMKTFIHKLGEVQSVTADIPETVQNKITELMVNHKKKILENLANIEKKVMQCATTIDAHLVS